MADHPVTRMVHFMSEAHRTKESVRTGNMPMKELARRTIFSPQHFPKFLSGVMAVSGAAGYFYMGYIHNRHLQRQDELHQIALQNSLQPVSRNQAAVRAMTRRYTVDSPTKLMKRLTVRTNELMNTGMGVLDPQS